MQRVTKTLRRALAATTPLSSIPESLLGAAPGESLRSLLVTSGRAGEGKTTVAIGIAAALAKQPKTSVLLVDASTRDPVLANWFEVGNEPGFCEWLGADPALKDVFHETSTSGLYVMSAGAQGAPVATLLANFPERMQTLLERFTYVVFDGDATLSSSGGPLLSRHVDGVVVVAECEKTKREVVAETRLRLERAGGRVLGVVLNKRNFYIPGVFYGKG